MDRFRFSPNTNLAHMIDWHPWGPEAFAKAQAENKPVLLSISAVWCHWCHVMDETSYSDPDVQQVINENFVCIRADNDRRPDLNARYNVGGWPTTAFLTGHGGLMGGATYLPPDQFLAMLGELHRAYREEKSQLYDQARELLNQRQQRAANVCAGPEVEVAFADRVARTLAGAYDAVNGGVGVAPKFPNGPILQYLLHLTRTTGEDFYRAMLEKTLDRMASGPLYDLEEGGFFRNSDNPDWSDPQLEKMLEDNVSLARLYLDAYPLLHNDHYLQVASQTVDYLIGNLFDPAIPGFHGSQGAHSEYFAVPLSGRRDQGPPPVDRFCYTSSSAQAVSLCLHAAWRLARPDLTEVAVAVLDHIDQGAKSGNLSHVYDKTGPGQEPSFLVDWANLSVSLVDAHGYTGRQHYLDRAKVVVRELLDRFFDETNGAFFDTERDSQAIGYLRVREKPLAENMAAATGLLKLHQATWDADYRQIAETTLSAFADSYHEFGEHGAEYGLAVDLLKNSPVEVTVEGSHSNPSTQAMLAAAARLPSPNLVIKTILVDGSQIPAQAHVCLDTLCLPPVEDPDLLADTVSSMGSPQSSPFENIFERLPGI